MCVEHFLSVAGVPSGPTIGLEVSLLVTVGTDFSGFLGPRYSRGIGLLLGRTFLEASGQSRLLFLACIFPLHLGKHLVLYNSRDALPISNDQQAIKIGLEGLPEGVPRHWEGIGQDEGIVEVADVFLDDIALRELKIEEGSPQAAHGDHILELTFLSTRRHMVARI